MTHLFASENQCASIFHEYFPDFDKSSGANSRKCVVWCSGDGNLRLDTVKNARNVARIQNKKLTSLEKNARHRKKAVLFQYKANTTYRKRSRYDVIPRCCVDTILVHTLNILPGLHHIVQKNLNFLFFYYLCTTITNIRLHPFSYTSTDDAGVSVSCEIAKRTKLRISRLIRHTYTYEYYTTIISILFIFIIFDVQLYCVWVLFDVICVVRSLSVSMTNC